MSDTYYDIVIIGAGLGGLICGAVLSKEGYRVAVLEKNRQFGGSLQTFSRNKKVFDSGVHYIGGLAPGQTLHQVLRYLGFVDALHLEPLDEDGFDQIVLLDEGKTYRIGQGYEKFKTQLLASFPDEEAAIDSYCETIRNVCKRFPLYNLELGEGMADKGEIMHQGLYPFLESITTNKRLQEVLAGNGFLYAADKTTTPLYVHALVVNSYIESAWRLIGGGSQISKYLVRIIRANGGQLFNRTEVAAIMVNDQETTCVTSTDGRVFSAKAVISNLHPKRTLDLTQSAAFRPAYRNRIAALPNTVSSFSVHAVLQPRTVACPRHNVYIHTKDAVWEAVNAEPAKWPQSVGVFFTPDKNNPGFAESVSLLTYMRVSEWQPWATTMNTDSQPSPRGTDYEQFKNEKAVQLIDLMAKHLPKVQAAIQSYTCATPLTFRDYIGTEDGSLYGIAKDYQHSLAAYLPTRTKLPNLFLTGQNVLLHGILGVTVSALTTCGEFMPLEQLVKSIKNA